MRDLRPIIAKNIAKLRTDNKMTQLTLAEVLNYSDKAVSKWERAEALPDVTVLKQIADYFGVSVDYLLEPQHKGTEVNSKELVRLRKRNRLIISLVSLIGVWVLASFVFAILMVADAPFAPWLMFIYATAVSSVVGVVFNSIWGIRKMNYLIVTLLLWSTLTSVYLTLLVVFSINIWALFIVGAPLQLILLFLPWLTVTGRRKEIKETDASSNAAPPTETAD